MGLPIGLARCTFPSYLPPPQAYMNAKTVTELYWVEEQFGGSKTGDPAPQIQTGQY